MLRAFAISPEEGGREGTKFKGRRSLWEFVILLSGDGWASVQLDGRGNFKGPTVYAQEIAPRLLRMFISKGGRVKIGLATGPLGNFCRHVGGRRQIRRAEPCKRFFYPSIGRSAGSTEIFARRDTPAACYFLAEAGADGGAPNKMRGLRCGKSVLLRR